MTAIVNTPGIASLAILESCEGRELLWRLSFKFEGKAAAGLRAFLRSHKTLRTITNKNHKVWRFYDLERGVDTIPIFVLKRLVDKMDYGFETAFRDVFCKSQEEKVKNTLRVTALRDNNLIDQISSRLSMLEREPPRYVSIESDFITIEDGASFHTTLIHWEMKNQQRNFYLANIEQGTFTRNNLGLPSMKRAVLNYGIEQSLINTCTPYVSTKRTKNPFNRKNYPLYVGNIGSLIHFYESVVNQIFEILSPLCQFEIEVEPSVSFRHMSPEFFDLLSREFDRYFHPMKQQIPKVLKRLLLLQKNINTSADLFFLYHKHIPIDLPEYFEGFWKSKLDVLSVFSNYGKEFMALFEETKELEEKHLNIYLDKKDLALAQIITRVLFSLKELIDEVSSDRLVPYLVFCYVPRLLDLRRVIEESITDITENNLEVDLNPVLKRIDNQLHNTAKNCKAVFVAGAMHLSKAKEVITCYKQLTNEPFELKHELSCLCTNLYNTDEVLCELKLSGSNGNVNDSLLIEENLQKYVDTLIDFNYSMWNVFCRRPLYIDETDKEMFLRKNVGFKGSMVGENFKYTYFRKGNDSKNSYFPSLSITESLSCDNKMTALYLLGMLSTNFYDNGASPGHPNVLAAVTNYLSCIEVNSMARMMQVLTRKSSTYDKLSRVKQLSRLQLCMVNNEKFDPEHMGMAFLRSFGN